MRIIWIVALLAGIDSVSIAQNRTTPPAGLKILVIEGEGAVNIIQQRTAVAPLVEVRDGNNLPVPGVAVTFSVGGKGATFGGLQTLTVTTNAAGQAVATGLTPVASGAIQINASAAVQGQTIMATITQTNFATAQAAAQAATAAGSGSSAGTAGGAATGSGGGLSTGAVVGIVGGVGAAAAGGAVLARAQGDDASPAISYSGPLEGQWTIVQSFSGSGQNVRQCSFTHALRGTLRITLEQSTGPATGTGEATLSSTDLATSAANCGSGPGGGNLTNGFNCMVTGTTDRLECVQQRTTASGNVTSTYTMAFSGALSGGAISGTVTYGLTGQGSGVNEGGSFTSSFTGSTTFAVTLR